MGPWLLLASTRFDRSGTVCGPDAAHCTIVHAGGGAWPLQCAVMVEASLVTEVIARALPESSWFLMFRDHGRGSRHDDHESGSLSREVHYSMLPRANPKVGSGWILPHADRFDDWYIVHLQPVPGSWLSLEQLPTTASAAGADQGQSFTRRQGGQQQSPALTPSLLPHSHTCPLLVRLLLLNTAIIDTIVIACQTLPCCTPGMASHHLHLPP